MRPSRFTDAQVSQALQDVRDGEPAAAVCRRLGITQTTFYRWRARCEGTGASDARELRDLREENGKLKEIVAELLLEKRERGAARRGT